MGLAGSKKAVAFLKKSDAKNFCFIGTVAAKPARPSLKEFLRRFFQKAAASLFRPHPIRL
jgi:hypothetical protein